MKKIPLFYKILLIFLGVLAAAICISLIYLWSFLSDYQAGLPIYAVEDIVEDVAMGQYDKILNENSFAVTDFEEKDTILKFMENGFKNKSVSYKKMYSRKNSLYAIYANDSPILHITFIKNKGKYTVSNIEPVTEIGVEIDLPEGFNLYIGDKKADNKWIEKTITPEETGYDKLFCMTGKKQVINSYRILGLINKPEIRVTDYEGKDVNLTIGKKLTVKYDKVTFNVPVEYTPYINGKMIDSEYITRTNIDSGTAGITLNEYTVDGVLDLADYKVKDKSGKEMLLTLSEDVVSLKKMDFSINVPEGYGIYINGVKLGNEYIEKKNVEISLLQYVPDKYVDKPVYDGYKITVFGQLPDLKVKDLNGNDVKTIVNDQNAYAYFSAPSSIAESLGEIVKDRAMMYSKYVTADLTWYNLQKVLLPDTAIYSTLKDLQTYWYTRHIRYEFKDVKLENMQQYADNLISCDISYNHIIYKTEKEIFTYPSDFTFYLAKVNDIWYIMDFTVN